MTLEDALAVYLYYLNDEGEIGEREERILDAAWEIIQRQAKRALHSQENGARLRHCPKPLFDIEGVEPHLLVVLARAQLIEIGNAVEDEQHRPTVDDKLLARAMTEALGRLDLPAAVLASSGRVLSTNALFDKMKGQFTSAAGGRLVILHRPANDVFEIALGKSNSNGAELQSYSIPVPAAGDLAACVAHLVPVRRQARDIFPGAATIFVVTPLTSPKAPPAHILHGLFDLSPAEAKVAQSLVEGLTIKEIATINSLSRETIRNQLRAVLMKTGTHRQAELVGLLAGAQVRTHSLF